MIRVKVPSRFTIPVLLSRSSGGAWEDGKWIETLLPTFSINVSWQALSPSEYRILPEGESAKGAYKAFWNGPFQTGIDGVRRSDHLMVKGIIYKLLFIHDWVEGGFTVGIFGELKP